MWEEDPCIDLSAHLEGSWEPSCGKDLGIIGLGSMRILYYDIAGRKDFEEELGIEFRSLEDLLRESGFASIHVPLTEETRHIMGKNS